VILSHPFLAKRVITDHSDDNSASWDWLRLPPIPWPECAEWQGQSTNILRQSHTENGMLSTERSQKGFGSGEKGNLLTGCSAPHVNGQIALSAGGAVGDPRRTGRSNPASPHSVALDQLQSLSFSSVFFRGEKR